MRIPNVTIDKVTASWASNRRLGAAKGIAKVVLSFETDDINALAYVQSLYEQTVDIDFGVPETEVDDDDRS